MGAQPGARERGPRNRAAGGPPWRARCGSWRGAGVSSACRRGVCVWAGWTGVHLSRAGSASRGPRVWTWEASSSPNREGPPSPSPGAAASRSQETPPQVVRPLEAAPRASPQGPEAPGWGCDLVEFGGAGFVPSPRSFSFRHLVGHRLPQKLGALGGGAGEGAEAGEGTGLPVRNATLALAVGHRFGPCLQMVTPNSARLQRGPEKQRAVTYTHR